MSPFQYQGGCHCGNIRYQLNMPFPRKQLPARACECDFCTRIGGCYTASPEGALSAEIEDAKLIQPYRFGTSTADFIICGRCGNVPFVTSEIVGQTYAVVNLKTLDGFDPAISPSQPTNFDGETKTDRLARRQAHWIPSVSIRYGSP